MAKKYGSAAEKKLAQAREEAEILAKNETRKKREVIVEIAGITQNLSDAVNEMQAAALEIRNLCSPFPDLDIIQALVELETIDNWLTELFTLYNL